MTARKARAIAPPNPPNPTIPASSVIAKTADERYWIEVEAAQARIDAMYPHGVMCFTPDCECLALR